MPAFRKSTSSSNNISILPLLRSASSKFSITALSSTSSIGAFFSSSTSTSGSSKSIMSGIRGAGRDKENTEPSSSFSHTSIGGKGKCKPIIPRGKSAREKTKKGRGIAYPEISAPQMAPESLEAVRARFTLVPLRKIEPYMEVESDMVIIDEVDYLGAPVPQKKAKASRAA